MPEYSEIACKSHEAANASHVYLLSQLNEDENAPLLTASVEGASLHVAYEHDGEPQRDAWDKQLIGFRDGFELCQSFYKATFDDSTRRAQATSDAVNFVNSAPGI